MKIRLIYLWSCLLLCFACQEADYIAFEEPAAVQFGKADDKQDYTFVFEPSTVVRDTVHIRVCLVGHPSEDYRHFKLKQVAAVEWKYDYDKYGVITDSILVELRQGIENTHFLSPAEEHCVIAPNSVECNVPVIVLRDTSLETHEYHICFQLEPTADLQVGESAWLRSDIILSDILQKPTNWDNTDINYASVALGEYSRVKHRFMIDASGLEWNDEILNSQMSFSDLSCCFYWQAFFQKKLAEYINTELNGKPLIDENGKEVTFTGIQ